jgi:hypothetical protein
MPSIIPGYVYSLFAALIVGTIIVAGCSAIMANVKNTAETQQLKNIETYVATQSAILINQAKTTDANSTLSLSVPTQIGNQQYWIRIENDSTSAWIEAGLGTTIVSSGQETYIPAQVAAQGTYISSNGGRALLSCQVEDQTIFITLTNG